MLVAMIALTGLVLLGGLTVLSVQSSITSVGHDRHKSVALYAAESGAAAAFDFLRRNVVAGSGYSAYVEPNNTNPQKPAGIAGNTAIPGQVGNLFSTDMQAWYEVEILNNLDDPGFAAGDDEDERVIIRSTGHGANGALAQVEWEVAANAITGLGRPCPTYAQRGMGEDNAGRNDCLSEIAGPLSTYTPTLP